MAQPPEPKEKTELKLVSNAVEAFVRWAPIGGSGGLLIHFLLRQEWIQAVLAFPVTLVAAVWAAYTEGLMDRVTEAAKERGQQDGNQIVNFFSGVTRAIELQVAGFDEKYLDSQAGACRRHRPEGVRTSIIRSPLQLDEIYVPLGMNVSGEFKEQKGLRSPITEEELETLQGEKNSLQIWDFLARAKTDSRFQHIAISAVGGCGKTTLLQHLTYTYASQPKRVGREHGVPRLVPVLLYLRECREQLAQKNPPTLAEVITEFHIRRLPGLRAKPPVGWAENLLHRNALVMLDGFDEVAEEQRSAVSRWIAQQIRDYSESFFILTSRPVALKDCTASDEMPLTLLNVIPFTEKQREEFVHKWYLSMERATQLKGKPKEIEAEANEKATGLLQQIDENPDLDDLSGNPLLLTMLTALHWDRPFTKLPSRRSQLYQDICELLLRYRPEKKEINLALDYPDSQQVLQGVALEMTQQQQSQVPLAELLQLLQTHLEAINSSVSAKAFLAQIEKFSELVFNKDGEYQFSHRSFQEYLAAVEISRRNQEVLLYDHLENEFWLGTILLYASLRPDVSSLIREACRQQTKQAVETGYRCLQVARQRNPETPGVAPELIAKLQDLRYRDLEALLSGGQWKEADYETYRLMIRTVGKEVNNYFLLEELLNFPEDDLRRLNYLWLTYSNGQFGFSVQKNIYLECGGIPDGKYYRKAWEKFAHTVGWKKEGNYIPYPEYIFSLSAPIGHLPVLGICGAVGFGLFSSLASRLVNLNL